MQLIGKPKLVLAIGTMRRKEGIDANVDACRLVLFWYNNGFRPSKFKYSEETLLCHFQHVAPHAGVCRAMALVSDNE